MLDEKLLSRILLDEGIYTQEEFLSLVNESRRLKESLESYILRKKFFTTEGLYKLLAQVLELPFAHISPDEISTDTLSLIPESFAISHSIVSHKFEKNYLFLATSNPNSLNFIIRDYIESLTGLSPKITITSPTNIREILKKYARIKKYHPNSKSRPPEPQTFTNTESHSLQSLGIEKSIEERLKKEITSRPGIIFVSGSPKSGKTTLLHALLKYFDTKNHIMYSLNTHSTLFDSNLSHIKRQKSLEDYVSIFSNLLRGDSTFFLIDGLYDIAIIREALRAAESGRTILLSWESQRLGSAFLQLVRNGISLKRFQKSLIAAIETHRLSQICPRCIVPASEEGYCGKGCSSCLYTGHEGSLGAFEIEVHKDSPKLLLSLKDDLKKKVEFGKFTYEDASSLL